MDIYQKIYNVKYFEKLRNSNAGDKEKFLYFHEGGNQGASQYLDEFKKHLQLAEESKAINHDRKGKLVTFEWETFIQAKAELQAAYYFKEKLGFTIGYEPKRVSNGKGDIEIIIPDQTIVFVEVTTPIRQRSDVVHADSWNNYQKSVIITSLSGKYDELPTDGRSTMIIIGKGLDGGRLPVSGVLSEAINEFYGENRENLSAVGFLDFTIVLVGKSHVLKYNLEIYTNPSALVKLPEIISRNNIKYLEATCC